MANSGFFVDITPLRRFRQFRRLWNGLVVAELGAQLGLVAASYQVYRLTGSSLDVGFISLAELFPALIGSIAGGAVADAMDRRTLLIFTEVAMALCTVGLAINAHLHHPSLALIYVLAGLTAGFSGVDGPTHSAMLMETVDRNFFVAANTLRQIIIQISVVVGPAVGGLLLAPIGVTGVYWINAGAFGLAIGAVLSLKPHPPTGGGTRLSWSSMGEGFRFLRGRQALQACFVSDLDAMILGMPTALFPALGLSFFHGGTEAVGYLYAAPGVGALIATVGSGWTARVRFPGRAVVISVAIWGLAITCFGLMHLLWVALILLAIAGAADVVSAVFRSTILHLEAPDELRGRISAIQQAVVTGGPRLGNIEAGAVAAAVNNQFSVVSGGIGCVLGIAIVARAMPKFMRYEMPTTRGTEHLPKG